MSAPSGLVAGLGAVHFVGIGGAGMSGLARILLARGHRVSGSDIAESATVEALRDRGARVTIGHHSSNIDGADTVVTTTAAIGPANCEVVEARLRGVPVMIRAEVLAALARTSATVAVAGTHGKTTTTSMATVAWQHCGLDPSFAIGGDPRDMSANAHSGADPWFIAEADESDGSFLLLSPYVAIVTNVDADHLDFHGTVSAYRAVFDRFCQRIVADGFLVICADDPGARDLAAVARGAGTTVHTYGFAADADLRMGEPRAEGTGTRCALTLDGAQVADLVLGVPGRHIASDAAAALLAGLRSGLDPGGLRAGLAAFTGVARRFELRGEAGGVRVYDDYAHHPSEVRAQLLTAREVAGSGRVVVAFQPHLYSRTAHFAADFADALSLADEVVVMDVYAAREPVDPAVSGAMIAERITLAAGAAVFEPSWAAVAGRLVALAATGDLVLTLGAGDVTMIGAEVLAILDSAGSGSASGQPAEDREGR